MPVPRNVEDPGRVVLADPSLNKDNRLRVPAVALSFLRVQDQAMVSWLGTCRLRNQPVQTVMATASRAFAQMKDLQDSEEKRPTLFPGISISRGTIDPDMTRFQRSDVRVIRGQRVFAGSNCDFRRILPWPTPYNINYLVELKTKTPQDGNLIIQDILGSWRHPVETFIRVDYGENLGNLAVPLHLQSVDDVTELEPGEEDREYTYQLGLMMLGWMPRLACDVRTVKVINTIWALDTPENKAHFCDPENVSIDPETGDLIVIDSPTGGLLETQRAEFDTCPQG